MYTAWSINPPELPAACLSRLPRRPIGGELLSVLELPLPWPCPGCISGSMPTDLHVGATSLRGSYVDVSWKGRPLYFFDEVEFKQDETLALVTFFFLMFLIKLPGSLTPWRD